jgi:hypothetical protein
MKRAASESASARGVSVQRKALDEKDRFDGRQVGSSPSDLDVELRECKSGSAACLNPICSIVVSGRSAQVAVCKKVPRNTDLIRRSELVPVDDVAYLL